MHFVTYVFLCDDAYAVLFRKGNHVVSILAFMEWLRISISCLEVYLSNNTSYRVPKDICVVKEIMFSVYLSIIVELLYCLWVK